MRFVCVILLSIGMSFFFYTDCGAKYKNQPPPPKIINTPEKLSSEINQIIQDLERGAKIGIQIKSMTKNDMLYQKNESRLFIPASILKLLIAEAALLYLGPDYKFPTTLLTDATITHGMINGNVYLVQTGDPTLTYLDLNDLMLSLKSEAIHGINGNVFIDTSAYDESNFGPGWIWDDKRFCWSAPINASIINRNCLYFKITPGKKLGSLASIIKSPNYYYGAIRNSVITKKTKSRCTLQLARKNDSIDITGCMPKGNYAWGINAVISDIKQYNLSLFRNLFSRFGIIVKGHILTGGAPANLNTIAIHESKPLSVLVNDMLKMSDNIIAGSLLKKMGEFYSRMPGSWKNGGEAVKQILARNANIDPTQMIIVDGSGLSRDNRIKPNQLMQVLDFAYHHYDTNYEFVSALPIAGVDGTLKRRLSHIARKVRAKTGTMSKSGVVSLAGYAVSKDKEPIAFVIIVNGSNGSAWKYREMEDKIVTLLTQFRRG